MIQEVLYERLLPQGPSVRIRRTSPEGEQPVTVVLDVSKPKITITSPKNGASVSGTSVTDR